MFESGSVLGAAKFDDWDNFTSGDWTFIKAGYPVFMDNKTKAFFGKDEFPVEAKVVNRPRVTFEDMSRLYLGRAGPEVALEYGTVKECDGCFIDNFEFYADVILDDAAFNEAFNRALV